MFSENDLLYKIPETSILSVAKGSFAKRVGLVICEASDSPENTIFLKKVLEAAGLGKRHPRLHDRRGGSIRFFTPDKN